MPASAQGLEDETQATRRLDGWIEAQGKRCYILGRQERTSLDVLKQEAPSLTGEVELDTPVNVNIDFKSKDARRAITKFIDAVSGAIGTFNDPQHVVDMAQAKKVAQVVRAEGKVQSALTLEKGRQDLEKLKEKAEQRLANVEIRRQRNLEAITAQAVLALPIEVADENPLEDWIYQFFDLCADIGNEEMQLLWGKLLAGEIAQPGSYSIRTLSAVKLLDRMEADIFTKLCSYVWKHANLASFVVAGKIRGPARRTERTGLTCPGELQEVTPKLQDWELTHLRGTELVETISWSEAYTWKPLAGELFIPIQDCPV